MSSAQSFLLFTFYSLYLNIVVLYSIPNLISIWSSIIELLLFYLVSRSQEVDFVYFIFLSHFYFSFDLLFIFLFLEQLGLGSEVICHTVTSVTI